MISGRRKYRAWSDKNENNISHKWCCRCESAPYPFTRKVFERSIRAHVEEQILKKRQMQFGSLSIDQYAKEVRVKGNSLGISSYEYEAFLILMKHIGEVLPREMINQYLPLRQRDSLRNVDTHVKNIRRKLGGKELV